MVGATRIACSAPGCDRRAAPNSTFCSRHVRERDLEVAAKRAGVELSRNEDGTTTIIRTHRGERVEQGDGKPRRKRGENLRAVAQLQAWIREQDPEGVKRFAAQLSIARTLAQELDLGDTRNASSFRALIKDINTRLDAVYGSKNLDILESMRVLIETNVQKRAERGWDG